MNNSEIIKLLEGEMSKIPSNARVVFFQENENISLDNVQSWYVETEKLLRVSSNLTLNQAEHQVINQLRYAGHHILKLNHNDTGSTEYKSNLLEAYKHCIRAYYDVLDGFVLTFSDMIQNKIMFIKDKTKRQSLTSDLSGIMINITSERFKQCSRAEYYSFVVDNIIEGLKLFEKVLNEIPEPFSTKSAEDIVKNNHRLLERNRELEANIANNISEKESIIGKFSIYIAISIAIATFSSIVFQGFGTNYYLTNKHEVKYISPENTTLKSEDYNRTKNITPLKNDSQKSNTPDEKQQ